MTGFIKMSKTDPFSEGMEITIPKLNSDLCPVASMVLYLSKARHDGPLFKFQSGSYLTRDDVQAIFTKYLGGNINLNTHSLRIGGATLLSKAGVPEHIIQKIGRWRSDCFKKYVRMSLQHVEGAYKAIEQYVNS